ncbi:MAG: hypothetical protein IJ315_03075, partial [Firmicutes bacterium]|nr:hypothetical protein [Bacillota bacterium]
MRRFISVLLVMLLLSSCAVDKETDGEIVVNNSENNYIYLANEKFATDQYLEEYDIQRQFQTLTTGLCETENAFYSLTDDFIIYIDKQSGYSGVLCGKPECTHGTIDCNGQVYVAAGLTVYDHQLYWVGWEKVEFGQVSHLYLWRMDLDGTNREKVKQMDEELNSMLNGDRFVQIHRGYVYMAGGTSIVNKGIPSESTIVYAESMNSDEEPIIIINKEHFNEPSPHHRIQLIGNQLYIMI